MVTAATLRRSSPRTKKGKAITSQAKLVQQTFQWDAPSTAPCGNRTANPKKSRPLPATNSNTDRMGRCEQVGGLMETVLMRYGISPEELRLAVEELRASRTKVTR